MPAQRDDASGANQVFGTIGDFQVAITKITFGFASWTALCNEPTTLIQ